MPASASARTEEALAAEQTHETPAPTEAPVAEQTHETPAPTEAPTQPSELAPV